MKYLLIGLVALFLFTSAGCTTTPTNPAGPEARGSGVSDASQLDAGGLGPGPITPPIR